MYQKTDESTLISSLSKLKAVGIHKVALLNRQRIRELLSLELQKQLPQQEDDLGSAEMNDLCNEAMQTFQHLLKDYLSDRESVSTINPKRLQLSEEIENDDCFYVLHSGHEMASNSDLFQTL